MIIMPSKVEELEENLKNKKDIVWKTIYDSGLKYFEDHLVCEVIEHRYGLLESVNKICLNLNIDRRTYYFYREMALNYYLCAAVQAGKITLERNKI